MSGWKKLAAASAASSALNVEDVFAIHLYKGTSSQLTITNGIDLATEGGLVWTKNRSNSTNHALCDTVVTGVNKDLSTSNTAGTNTETNAIDQFNSDGYRIAGISTTIYIRTCA